MFPVAPGGKAPAVDKDWEHVATTDHARIDHWRGKAPFNIGIATGPSVCWWRTSTSRKNHARTHRRRGETAEHDPGATCSTSPPRAPTHRSPQTWKVITPSGGPRAVDALSSPTAAWRQYEPK
ncbi:bifunctional DNA primase/polymerase-like protein [Kribbella sp. VKM Ac-2568]|nr:bifunctional DNA primase/polymerase-like protein [Kribbella sp. VKM Ac-2568]